MPQISTFHGIVILMFSSEGAHAVPHFHARYAEHEASIGFDGALIADGLPPAQLRLVRSWSARHRVELEANWDRARLGQRLEAIDPSPNLLTVADVPSLVDITGLAVIGDHQLRLLFEDGTVGDISFEDHDWQGVFEPLRDPACFAKVTIQYGTIVWPDYDLDMAPEPLYQAAREHPLAPAHSAR